MSLLVFVLLFLLLRYPFLDVFTKAAEARENEIMELKMSTMMDIISDVNTRRAAAYNDISDNLKADIRMMTNLLREFVTADGYDGPRSVDGGFVAELQSGRVILPQEYRGLEKKLSREIIEESIQSGAVMSFAFTPEDFQTGEDAPTEQYFLSFGEIARNIIYVSITPEREYGDYLEGYTRIVNEALESANDSLGGITLELREKDGEAVLVRRFGSASVPTASLSQELLQEVLCGEKQDISLEGKDYHCAASRFEAKQSEEGTPVFVQLLPKMSLQEENIPRVQLLGLVMLVILIAVTVYTVSVQHAMAERELSEELKKRYSPRKMRLRLVKSAVLSIIITFVIVVLLESVGLMYTELRNGRDILNLFSNQIVRNDTEKDRPIEKKDEEWYVSCGQRLAALLSGYPALNTPEKLRESSEALGVEMITLFDPQGRQSLCSGDYTGFRLDDEENPELDDFKRLLYGVPSIVHEVSVDPITGLERQQIGVTMPVPENASMHGALIMTRLPQKSANAYEDESIGLRSSASGTICFAADSTDGVILYSSKPGMTRKLVSECGLPEDSLRGSIVDFATITGNDYLMISSRDGRSVCYYAAGTDTVFGKILQVGAVVSLIFAVVLALLLVILLRGYNEKNYQEWEKNREKTLEHIQQRRAPREEIFGPDENREAKKSIFSRLLSWLDWEQRSAGSKAAVILHIGMDILIVCVLNILNHRLLPNDSSGTMLRFFMEGEWIRGVNLFSLCGILLLIAIAYLVNVLCSLLIKLTGSIFSPSGETLIRLLYSSIRYVTAIAVFCYGLDYLGFSTGTIVASLGVLSLALSLGAQDLIKDILAGLAIVFDGSFRIGDVVEVDGTEGIVQEIGVRATKLTVEGNNTLYINNSEISSVLNKSKELSRINLEFRIPINESLPKLEELLNRELPEIGRKNSKIVKGPELLGLTGLSGAAASRVIQLAIEVMIDQKDEAEVKSYLYREIHLLFEREGIDIE